MRFAAEVKIGWPRPAFAVLAQALRNLDGSERPNPRVSCPFDAAFFRVSGSYAQDALSRNGDRSLCGPEEPEPALASSSHPPRVCYHPATVRPGTIHHAEA